MASVQEVRRACSPSGARAILHRQARAICGKMPKANDSSIHPQFMSCVTHCMNSCQSVARYIHHNMPKPSTNGSDICSMIFSRCFIVK